MLYNALLVECTILVSLAGFHNFRREFAMSLFHTFPICRIQICKERKLLRRKKKKKRQKAGSTSSNKMVPGKSEWDKTLSA